MNFQEFDSGKSLMKRGLTFKPNKVLIIHCGKKFDEKAPNVKLVKLLFYVKLFPLYSIPFKNEGWLKVQCEYAFQF